VSGGPHPAVQIKVALRQTLSEQREQYSLRRVSEKEVVQPWNRSVVPLCDETIIHPWFKSNEIMLYKLN
jgi:hypothetical protein